jgi:formamidopyrimidine-DNA glycosylase
MRFTLSSKRENMPELPEVETIKRDLTKKIVGKKIIEVKLIKPAVIKEPKPEEFKKLLEGRTVDEIIRLAKLLIIRLSGGKFLIVHLRISGWLFLGEERLDARDVFRFNDDTCLNYMDGRLLGQLRLRDSYQDLKFVRELAKEPFDITPDEFAKMLIAKKTKIKPLLLDQTFIAGIGNIYAQEALFMAGIDPNRRADSLTPKQARELHKAIVDVLNQGIEHRGSSVDIYRDTGGETGGMEKLLKIYGKENQPCCICKRPVQKTAIAGRGTCFCPHCQK